jgi:hypothetical protein
VKKRFQAFAFKCNLYRYTLEWMRWIFFLVGMAVSASFIFFNMQPLVGQSPKGVAFVTPFLACVVGMHVLFGVLLKLFFFQSF